MADYVLKQIQNVPEEMQTRVVTDQRYDLTGTSMFGQLVTRGTPTFVATDDVTARICLVQD